VESALLTVLPAFALTVFKYSEVDPGDLCMSFT
jgi:hypothetical protein